MPRSARICANAAHGATSLGAPLVKRLVFRAWQRAVARGSIPRVEYYTPALLPGWSTPVKASFGRQRIKSPGSAHELTW